MGKELLVKLNADESIADIPERQANQETTQIKTLCKNNDSLLKD
jgi:hypothetical protein